MAGLGDTLAYIGGSLDKPGRAVRGALAGKPREALAALPFSDTLGITDPGHRTSGRELTDQFGLTRAGDQGWGSWALGHGAEMLTDPVSYLPLGHVAGAMAKAGKFDGLGAALGRFGADEAGTAAARRVAPLPINRESMLLNSAANNASRPRRFSLDPAKKQWYADARQSRFGRRFGAFAKDESGAARIPRAKPDVYGLANPKAAAAERQAARPQLGHAIEAMDEGGYKMRPGPAPASREFPVLPHEQPPLPAPPPQHGPDADLAAEYSQLTFGWRPYPELEVYRAAPSEGSMRFAGEASRAAKQAVALGEVSSLGQAIHSPRISRLLDQFGAQATSSVGRAVEPAPPYGRLAVLSGMLERLLGGRGA